MAFGAHSVCFPLLVLYFLLLGVSEGRFQGSTKLQTREILLNYGAAHDSFSLAFIPDTESESVLSVKIVDFDKNIITDFHVRNEATHYENAVNITCELSFESNVGVTEYTLVIKTRDKKNGIKQYKMHGKYVVIGLVLYSEEGEIVSGEHSAGLTFKSYKEVLRKGARILKVVSQEPLKGSKAFDLSKAIISVNSLKGEKQGRIMDLSSLSMNKDRLHILPKPYRVSDKPEVITLTYPDYEVDGEIFETVLMVSVPNSKAPPPVVTGPKMINMTAGSEGEFDVHFFNLMSPPQKKKVVKVTIAVRKDGKERVIASAPYRGLGKEAWEETLHFKSIALKHPGDYDVQLDAIFEDHSSIPCHMKKDVHLRVKSPGATMGTFGELTKTQASRRGKSALSLPVTVVLGGIVGLASVIVIVIALLKYHQQREAEIVESNFSKSGPTGVPMEFVNCGEELVLRDTYVRTRSGLIEMDMDQAVENVERNPSIASSQYSI